MNKGVRIVSVLIAGLLSVSFSASVFASTPFVLTDERPSYPVGGYAEFLEDSDRSLTIDQMDSPQVQDRFFPSPNQNPNFGSTRSVYWAHLEIVNQSKQKDRWLLETKSSMLRDVTFYYKVQGQEQFRVVETGVMRPVENRDFEYRRFAFELPLAYGEKADIYLRVDNDWALFPLEIWTFEALSSKKSTEHLVYGFIYGAILAVAVFSFILWPVLRDISFFDFAGWLVFISILKSCIEGLGATYIWRNQFGIINILYSSSFILTFLFAIRFEQSFLLTKTYTPRLHRLFQAIQVFWLILLAVLVSGYIYIVEIIHISGLVCILLMLSGAVYVRFKGFKPATYYLLGWIVLFLVAAQALSTLWREGANYEDVEFILNTGVLLPMFFFAFALINRVVAFRKQREQELQLALQQAKEHETSMRKKNIELKQVNEEALQAKEAAEVANLAKSNFLTSISHELRTPLHQIIASSELIHMGFQEKQDDDGIELIQANLDAARHLLKMIDDILDISDIDQGIKQFSPSEVRLKTLLENMAFNHVNKSSKSDFRVTVEIPQEMEEKVILTDERVMKQILFNLFSNAIKFSNADGKIELKASLNQDLLFISVSDDGIGIAQEHLEKVFEPFFQVRGGTTGKTPGVGLGLTHSKKLVGLLKGEISSESEGLGKGSCFTIKIPMEFQI
ncbi:MAG: sensor histidine kinase [Proteobacteria bacterium]|nr:sensor histidine kinase [Pseudomonadota bacterium]